MAANNNALETVADAENDQKEISIKEAYFTSLSEWARHATDLHMFYNFLNCTQVSQESNRLIKQQAEADASAEELKDLQSDMELVRILDGEARLRIIQEWGGTEMIVAPFWKRAVAEIIDTVIIFILKMSMSFMFRLYSNLHFGKSIARNSEDEVQYIVSVAEDSVNFFNFSYDELVHVFLSKLMICLYECLWTTYNYGSTPGKYLMNIRLVHVETMAALEPQRAGFQFETTGFWALICPAVTPSALRTLIRVFIKSLISVLFFPLCIILIFPRNNRTTYDIITKTLVVERNTERPPTLARPRAY